MNYNKSLNPFLFLVTLSISFLITSCKKTSVQETKANIFTDIKATIKSEARSNPSSSILISKLLSEVDSSTVREYHYDNNVYISVDFKKGLNKNTRIDEDAVNNSTQTKGKLENSALLKNKNFNNKTRKLIFRKENGTLLNGHIYELESTNSIIEINQNLPAIINFNSKNYSGTITTRALNKKYLNTFLIKNGVLQGYSRIKRSKPTIIYGNTNTTSCIQWYLEVTIYYTDGTYDIYNYDLGEPQCSNPCQPDPTLQTEVPDCTNMDDGTGSQYEDIIIEEDDSPTKDSINIIAFLDCFDNIPNANSTFEVKLLVDIPVNNNPALLLNVMQRNPGHAFLQLTKSNTNGQTITQSIGFYPNQGLRSLALNPTKSKISDDGNHEYNASYTITGISAAEFQQLINKLKQLSVNDYELDDFNCAAFVQVALNTTILKNRPIPDYKVTNLLGMNFMYSPIGLYKSLTDMKSNTPGIETSVNKKNSLSKGPC